MTSIFNPSNLASINQRFRKKRFEFFIQFVENHVDTSKAFTILDIGGTQEYWQNMGVLSIFPNCNITLINLEEQPEKDPHFNHLIGDACDLSRFNDKSFDIVFSNSVIEHLYTHENQKKMATEAMRVGKNHFIQTPNFFFPMEPHWMFPGFQFLPKFLKVFLTSHFSLGHYPKESNTIKAIERVNEVRLLSKKEMRQLFVDSKMYEETFLGLTKSITMYNH